jgi:hypothetical protein
MWTQLGTALSAFAIVCDQAHVASPIVLAWSHPGLRRIALSRPIETILLPVIAVIGALTLPFVVVMWVYLAWNIYHFGAQHYGISRIFGLRSSRWLCVGGTAVLMVGGPMIVDAGWWGRISLFAIEFNHWLADIGLSSRVSHCWWLFVAGVTALGCIGFLWQVPRADHIATLAIPWAIQARWGVGIAHFLYSRWVWRLSDSRVRAAIGKDLWGTRRSSSRDLSALGQRNPGYEITLMRLRTTLIFLMVLSAVALLAVCVFTVI